MSIPRLELTVAVVFVRLNRLIHSELEYPIHDTVYWTDSTSVLQYIANVSRRFQTFVANRLAIIHDESTPSQWRYVNTKLNPADPASRGLNTTETSKIHLWLTRRSDGCHFQTLHLGTSFKKQSLCCYGSRCIVHNDFLSVKIAQHLLEDSSLSRRFTMQQNKSSNDSFH